MDPSGSGAVAVPRLHRARSIPQLAGSGWRSLKSRMKRHVAHNLRLKAASGRLLVIVRTSVVQAHHGRC